MILLELIPLFLENWKKLLFFQQKADKDKEFSFLSGQKKTPQNQSDSEIDDRGSVHHQ